MRPALFALLAAAVVALALLPLSAAGQTRTAPMAGGMVVESMQMSAKVVAIDQARHTVTLQMPSGKSRVFRVGKNVKNLGQLKVGDTISATLVDALAMRVEKGGPKPGATETTTVMLSPKGAHERMIVADTIRLVGKVEKVDARNRTISIMGPAHQTRMFKVGPNVKNLSSLKPGDDVVVRYTEALAIGLRKPGK
jgi:hypothetical protein